MDKRSCVDHYRDLAEAADRRTEAIALLMSVIHHPEMPLWLENGEGSELHDALLDLGVSREELAVARERAGI